MTKWVTICNSKYYDVFGAFDKFEKVNWKQTTSIEIGDTVFIYVSKPFQSIVFKTKATKVKLSEIEIDDSDFVINGSNYENKGRYMELELLDKYDHFLLTYPQLSKNGLSAVRGPSKIDTKLSEFISSKVSDISIIERKYFFVFQNKSFHEEYNGGFLWAPQTNDKGRNVSHWNRLTDVRKGDIIIHSFNKRILSFGIANDHFYSSTKPNELSEHGWHKRGWRVDLDYYIMDNPIITSDCMEELLKLQPTENAPFNKSGRGNTGYLFASNEKFLEFLINESNKFVENQVKISQLLGEIYSDEKQSSILTDQDFIMEIDKSLSEFEDSVVEYVPLPVSRPDKVNDLSCKYKRNKMVSIKAIKRANYKCEVNNQHTSFIRKTNNKTYTEPHHLIPMSKQNNFKYSLDVEANILSLCSNCHNHIHYGLNNEELIKKLYDQRKEELLKCY